MTKEEAKELIDSLEDLIEAIADRRDANDGEFGDGGLTAQCVRIRKEHIIKLLTKD